jgi:ubiquinone biosynthesis protein UbiJ
MLISITLLVAVCNTHCVAAAIVNQPPDTSCYQRVEIAVEIARGSAERLDVTIEADPATLATLVYDGPQLDEALSSGDLKLKGDESAVDRFQAPLTPSAFFLQIKGK